MNQIAAKYKLNPQMGSQWNREFVAHAGDVFGHHKNGEVKLRWELQEKEARYREIIGQLRYNLDFLEKLLDGYKLAYPFRILNSLSCMKYTLNTYIRKQGI
ncbi:hypothetical protein [uncultured Sphaerochaeta sp.]|uniref:hypothetical protein n=1 Tax=uncultured Sphaerochaeta sp. TaxID=886478 RepID=UPI002A0A8510|nr:hypothetical protein [uncultured Sphaerochaeta sp.]